MGTVVVIAIIVAIVAVVAIIAVRRRQPGTPDDDYDSGATTTDIGTSDDAPPLIGAVGAEATPSSAPDTGGKVEHSDPSPADPGGSHDSGGGDSGGGGGGGNGGGGGGD